MKPLIIYDSFFGNTEKIALAIGGAPGFQDDVKIMKVSDVRPDDFAGLKLLIIGSPTQRFRPTAAIQNLLQGIPKNSLTGVRVAVFDTRLTMKEISQTPILVFFVKLFGKGAYANKPIAEQLKKKGGELLVTPEGFFVEGMQGPLIKGELERAANWARQLNPGL